MEDTTQPLSYPDVLDHWDRSRSFGDPRDFRSFANDMEELHPGAGFGAAAARDGWWTRLSTRLDQNVFQPVAQETTAPLGEEIGGLFGGGGAKVGRDVGMGIPRMAAQLAPLAIPGVGEAYGGSLAAGLLGTEFGAQTYADTGSPKAALISGATAALLPTVSRIGGAVAPRALGLGESIPGVGVLPKAGVSDFAFKAAQFGGSQAAMVGANELSNYAVDKTLGQPFDPLDPHFLATQIPWTAWDLVGTAKAKIPSIAEAKASVAQPASKPKTRYTPPEVSQPEADATIEATLANLQNAYADPTTPPEVREASLAAASALIQNPKGVTEAAKVGKVAAAPEATTEIVGRGRELYNGNWKVLTTDDRTVFVNGVKPTTNPDGTLTFAAAPSQVKDSLTPMRRGDFGMAEEGQSELPPQAQEWQGFAPEQQRTLEEHGVPAPQAEMPEDVKAELRAHADRIDEAMQQAGSARAKVAAVPTSAAEIPGLVGPEYHDPILESLKGDATPTQAVEKARLATQTPQVDEALQLLHTLREEAKTISITGRGKPQAQYADWIHNDDGENFPNRGFAEAFRDAHPEYESYVVLNAGKDKGFVLARQINKEVSLEGTKLDKVLVDATGSTALESRPDVSFEAALAQIDRATKAPAVFAREAGFDDISDAILALRQARVVFPLLREGKTFEEIQAALAAGKVAGFTSPRNAVAVMNSVREGLAGFQGLRNFNLDSIGPHDPELVKTIGVLDPQNGLENVMQWVMNHPQVDETIKDLVRRAHSVFGTKDVKFSVNLHDGMVYMPAENRINHAWLPDKVDEIRYAMDASHEYMHYAMRELASRNDPAAVTFRATLQESIGALEKSPFVPKVVRDTIPKMRKWYEEYNNSTDPAAASDELVKKWAKAVGQENLDWIHVAYAAVSPDELVAELGSSPRVIAALKATTLPTQRTTVLQKLSQVVNRLFGGKPQGDNALAQVLSGFDNYLSGSRVPPREVQQGPTLAAGANFFYGLAGYDPATNVLGGKHKLPNTGVVSETQLKSIGGIGKPLSDGEIELYKSLVPEAWDGGKVNVARLVEGLKSKGPVVETKELGGGNELPARREAMIHELETLGYRPRLSEIGEVEHLERLDGRVVDEHRDVLPENVQHVYDNLLGLQPGNTEPTGSRYSFLAPKHESEMPGYVEGLVRVPKLPDSERTTGEQRAKYQSTMYSGPHFGSEDTNVLAFYRGYEETLPDGTKAFHVIEVQSDWGQAVRKIQEAHARDNGQDFGPFHQETVRQEKERNPSHPLLRVYESLALKAAIAHAKEIGATKVILSDAETAMMTEGHDKTDSWRVVDARTGETQSTQPTEQGARQIYKDELARGEVKLVNEPSQSAGMRLHYDQTLPSAMEKLTGEKGTSTELGPHKAAQQGHDISGEFPSNVDAEGRPIIVGSPVFRDASGNPKTQITGRVYDISKVPDQQTLFENKTPSTTVRQSYNGRDFLRDSLIAQGVRPEALASRLDTIEKLYNTGDLQTSIDGFTREMNAGTLPATAEAGPLKPELTTALASGTPKDVNTLGKGLLAAEVPVHQELYQRMKEDFNTAKNLYNNVRKGLIPGEVPAGVREALQQAHVRLDALGQAISKQTIDIQRFNDLDNFTNTGMENTRVSGLSSNRLPAPPDPTEMQQEAAEALGLVDARRENSREVLERGKVAGAANWARKTFMFTQYLKQLIPAVRPAFDHVFQLQGETQFWKNELDAVYGMDPKNVGEMDKARVQANIHVASNETLMRAASDIKLWNQTQESAGAKPTLDDPFVKNILSRFNPKDRADIVAEANNAKAVHDHWTEVTAPRFLARKNMLTVAKVIALREQGMPPEQARELAGQFTSSIDQLKDPQTAQGALELLQTLRAQMQPNTYLAAFGLAKGLADDATGHLEFMRSRPNYVTEQRLDGKHAIRMVTPENKLFFQTYGSKGDALAKVTQLEAKGYKFLEYVPAQDLNVPYRGVDTELIGKLRELDMQRQQREATALQGLDPQIAATVLAGFNRANDYEESLAAFSPVPGAGYPTRHFVAGREELNMVQQQNMFYSRATNWMRHQLTRGETELDLLHPDLLANREATKLVRDHVGNVLTPDSQLARKMAEFTYNWKLAGNFGVNALHLVQSLNTGMAALIAETGGVGDALELTIKAQKAVIQRGLNGKWTSADHDWLDKRASAEGISGYATWEGDIGDSNRNALQFASTPLWQKPSEYLKYAARNWNNFFFRFNDRIGLISAFDLARSRGMGYDEAFNFARDVKNQGYFTGGKAQRGVQQWAAFGPQAKAVPQLMSSLQTYVQGWFSLLSSNYIKGFGKAPEGLTSVQISGAKKAFLYQLGAQAVLAGALGLPGVGQGMALVKQSTGVDVMSWLRQHLGELFDEDQQAGGMVTTLALHGATAAFTPVDISSRHMPSVPYIGVTPYKGFDISSLAGAPISTAADLVKGLMAASKGDTIGMSNILPEVLRGPLRLWQGQGDARDPQGNLITRLSPQEQFVTALGMKPARVTALQDVATAVKEANIRAKAEKGSITDNLATVYRKNGVEQGHAALIAYLQDHPGEDGKALVREVARKVQAQTVVPDWSQHANVGADLAGLGGEATSQAGRYSNLQDIQSSLGLQQRPNPREAAMMDEVDMLRQSDPYLSVQEAIQSVRSQRPRRPSPFALQ